MLQRKRAIAIFAALTFSTLVLAPVQAATKKPTIEEINAAKKVEAAKISHKIGSLLNDAVPKTILGMLSTAEELEDGLVFFKRWKLQLVDKNDYSVVDLYTNNTVYEHVSLLISALHIIFYVNKAPNYATARDKLIYSLDQEYFRCLENIKQFI